MLHHIQLPIAENPPSGVCFGSCFFESKLDRPAYGRPTNNFSLWKPDIVARYCSPWKPNTEHIIFCVYSVHQIMYSCCIRGTQDSGIADWILSGNYIVIIACKWSMSREHWALEWLLDTSSRTETNFSMLYTFWTPSNPTNIAQINAKTAEMINVSVLKVLCSWRGTYVSSFAQKFGIISNFLWNIKAPAP